MAIASSLLAPTSGLGKELTLKIAVTSDVHGNYFPIILSLALRVMVLLPGSPPA